MSNKKAVEKDSVGWCIGTQDNGAWYWNISNGKTTYTYEPTAERQSINDGDQSFFSGGTILDLGNNQKLAFFDIWLWYADNERRHKEIKYILNDMESFITQAAETPVIMVGDFNTHSHLDVTETEAALLPVTQEMAYAGFSDSYREVHPDSRHNPGYTWTPLYNERAIIESGQSLKNRMRRVDFIFYKGKKLTPYHSIKTEYHPVFWPSDHASVISSFYLN